MKNLIFTLLCLAFHLGAFSQSIERWVLASGSGSGSCGPNFISEFCIGETVVTTLEAANIVVTQGFKQPYTIAIITGNENTVQAFETKVWPNPAINEVNLSIKNAPEGEYVFELFDASGRRVIVQNAYAEGQETLTGQIHFEGLAAGPYVLSIRNENEILSIYKLMINNN